MKSIYKTLIKILILLTVIVVLVMIGVMLYTMHQNALGKRKEYQENIRFYEEIAKTEHAWIAHNQVANGAILFYREEEGTTNVVPYFSSIAAMSLLGQTSKQNDVEVVRAYLDWYFLHLNSKEQDVLNGAGTIFNYSIVMDKDTLVDEKSLNAYDSVDSYAATFLLLLNAYYDKTNDTDYIITNMDRIILVIDALKKTFDSVDLSKTKQEQGIKYLMDNVEVNQSLKDTITLLQRLSKIKEYQESSYYDIGNEYMNVLSDLLTKNTTAIEELLWNQEDSHYEIGLDESNSIIVFSGWNNFYADAIAQIFPIAFGVIEPDSERAKQLYDRFCNEYKWEEFEHFNKEDVSFYWCVLAYVGAMMGDEVRVGQFLSYYQRNIALNHDYPLYVAESGWCIMACDRMIEMYQGKMKEIGFFEFNY